MNIQASISSQIRAHHHHSKLQCKRNSQKNSHSWFVDSQVWEFQPKLIMSVYQCSFPLFSRSLWCLQKESTIHPAMDNMTWYGKSNSWIELNSGANWIVIESHLHWVKPPPSPTPEKNHIPSWLWGKSQSFLSSEGNRYCTGMLLFPWQDCMLCSTTYYYFHRIF